MKASSTKQTLQDDMKAAMRSQDKKKLSAIRLVVSALKQWEIDNRAEIDDERIAAILNKLSKQRQDSIQQYKDAKRDDLVAQEQYEFDLIKHYMPEPLSESEIEEQIKLAFQACNPSGMREMGKVMGILTPALQGRADMAKVSALVKAKLQ